MHEWSVINNCKKCPWLDMPISTLYNIMYKPLPDNNWEMYDYYYYDNKAGVYGIHDIDVNHQSCI